MKKLLASLFLCLTLAVSLPGATPCAAATAVAAPAADPIRIPGYELLTQAQQAAFEAAYATGLYSEVNILYVVTHSDTVNQSQETIRLYLALLGFTW